MLVTNPTFLRQSAEAVWDEKPREPGGYRNFTIPTENDDLFEVYLYADTRRVAIDHIGLDAQGKRFAKDAIGVSLGGEKTNGLSSFSSTSGDSCTQEALKGFNKFVRTFKEEAR